MKAVVVRDVPDDFDLNAGDEIEVIGFVYHGWELRAVYRDDEGYIWDVSTALLRMLPHVQDKAA